MTIGQLFHRYREALTTVYGGEEARTMAEMMMEGRHGVGRNHIFTSPEEELDVDNGALERDITRLSDNYPIQYLLGEADFYGRKFIVREGVLIPRPETEELVRVIIDNAGKNPAILDIGCGSGAIAVTLAAEIEGAEVEACDISETALDITGLNAALLGAKTTLFRRDILADGGLPHKYDIIVSNPPYIVPSQKDGMRENVLQYEPREALFIGEKDPLLFYRRIAELSKAHLNGGGKLFFEINELFGGDIAAMLAEMGFEETKVVLDLNDKERMVWTQWRE